MTSEDQQQRRARLAGLPGIGGQPRGRKRRVIVIVAAVVSILALAAGVTASTLFSLAPTTVTITPASRAVSNLYTLSAVTGAPDAARQQVGARLVSAATPAQTRTVSASGHLSAAATQAKGTLALRNWTAAPKTFTAGTVFPDLSDDLVINCPASAGTEMVLDTTVTVPAVGSAGGYSVAYAPGHVLEPGTIGNIPYNGEDGASCYSFLWASGSCNPGWFRHCWAIEPADHFSGGQDAYNGPVVQQSDLDSAANRLIAANQPDPQQVLQRQAQPNERLVGAPQCAAQVASDHQAGDHAAQVNVTVSFACSGEVYDYEGALAMAAGLLTQQAAANPGGSYALAGQIKTVVTSAVLGNQHIVALAVSAEGIWAYQFSAARQQAWAQLIAGKSVQEARRLLSAQPGVARVSIHVSGGNGQTLPSDPAKITIVVSANASIPEQH